MPRKLVTLVLMLGVAALAWLGDRQFPSVNLAKLTSSLIAIAVLYFVFKVLVEGVFAARIKEPKARYTFRKSIQALFLVASAIVVLRIWVQDPQALVVAYGLVGAGVAVALQDVFKNFAGALAIFLTGIYRVGDRIEVASSYGDVIDFGVFFTTLLELRGWVDGDQPTGRITMLPNGAVLSNAVHNYTKDHSFIWDEIRLPITYGSDWRKAIELIRTIVRERTGELTNQVEREISKLEEKYYLSRRNIEPMVYVTPTDNWVELHVRFVAPVRERRNLRNELSTRILERFEAADDIKIASQTMTVTTIQGSPR